MLKNISIEEISELEVKQICKDIAFSNLIPVACYKCGNEKSFSRRLFKINGVVQSKYADDKTQSYLEKYFLQKYSVEYIFFKIYGKDKDYIV